MNFPNESFFADLDVLNLNNTDPIQTEMAEETRERKPEDVDAFNVQDQQTDQPTNNESGQQQSEQKKVPFNYKSTATWVVRILDGVNGKVLPPLYKKKLFSVSDAQRAELIMDKERHGQPYELKPEEEALVKKCEYIEELVNAIPMSDEEKAELSEALADVMEEADMRLSPMNKLLITLGMVEGVRLLPLLTAKMM